MSRGVASANDLSLDVKDMGRGQAVAECLEVLEGPNDFLVARDLEELRVVRPGVAVAHDQVAAGQQLQRRHPGQPYSRQLVVTDAPDDLALRRDLNDPVVVAAG